MKLSFFENIEAVYVAGDLHGNFSLLKYKLREMKNSVIFIAGDCGIGFESKKHYENVYNSIKKILTENNVTILFVRGNHDDPAYFDGKAINFKYMIEKLKKKPTYLTAAIRSTGPLGDDVSQYIQVYQRSIEEVNKLIKKVNIV